MASLGLIVVFLPGDLGRWAWCVACCASCVAVLVLWFVGRTLPGFVTLLPADAGVA